MCAYYFLFVCCACLGLRAKVTVIARWRWFNLWWIGLLRYLICPTKSLFFPSLCLLLKMNTDGLTKRASEKAVMGGGWTLCVYMCSQRQAYGDNFDGLHSGFISPIVAETQKRRTSAINTNFYTSFWLLRSPTSIQVHFNPEWTFGEI